MTLSQSKDFSQEQQINLATTDFTVHFLSQTLFWIIYLEIYFYLIILNQLIDLLKIQTIFFFFLVSICYMLFLVTVFYWCNQTYFNPNEEVYFYSVSPPCKIRSRLDSNLDMERLNRVARPSPAKDQNSIFFHLI